MNGLNARNAKSLPVAERKARLAGLVERGELTGEAAAMIEVREPSAGARAMAAKLAGKAGRFLDGHGKRAAA